MERVNPSMTKEEFIEYVTVNTRLALYKEFPNSTNKEYDLPESAMIEKAQEIVNHMFNHIRDGVVLSYIIQQKGKQ